MPKLIDLSGQRFGRLTVIANVGSNKHGQRLWLCKCDCGNEITTLSSCLARGATTSCGCRRLETNRKRLTKHGGKGTRIYNIWQGMKERCCNTKNPAYKHYGGRGITVCQEWLNDFSAFRDWSTVNGYDDLLTIDRIDKNGNYDPSNCRWVTMKIQNNNRRNNKQISFNGKQHTISEVAEMTGIKSNTLYKRIWRKNQIKGR